MTDEVKGKVVDGKKGLDWITGWLEKQEDQSHHAALVSHLAEQGEAATLEEAVVWLRDTQLVNAPEVLSALAEAVEAEDDVDVLPNSPFYYIPAVLRGEEPPEDVEYEEVVAGDAA